MKRFVAAVALVAVLAPALAGIGHTADRLRVGYVTDAGAATDGAIGEHMYAGFVRAVKSLGISGRVLEVPAGRDPGAALAALARQRYDLIIAGGFILPQPVDAVARRFPNSRFLFVLGPRTMLAHRPRNVRGLVVKVEEAGYLAGYLAALMEKKRPGKDVIGAIGGVAQVPDVANYIGGYRAGAQKADPAVRVITEYSRDFSNPVKCRTVALHEIAEGAGVVFPVAGACGIGALAVAQTRRVWGIGVDIDEASLGPQILTSAVIRPEVSFRLVIEALERGEFEQGSDVVLTVRNGGAGLGRISPKVPQAFLQQLEAIRRRIGAGSITIPRVPG